MSKAIFGVLGLGVVAVLLASCSDDGEGDGEASGGSNGTGGTIGIGTGGSGLVGNGPECETLADCGSGELCHPFAQMCVQPGAECTAQSDCAGGTYCDTTNNRCLAGTTGSPCRDNSNCLVSCTGGFCGCQGLAHEQELDSGPLDIYLVFDRTSSMGQDCAYQPGGTPPVNSKACFATYALNDYLINVTPQTDTRLALQFMSLPGRGCDGTPYATPLIGLTQLPVDANHALVQAISNENFAGGFGTEIEGALRGITQYTAANRTPGRAMIGVLMTDGDPNGCEGSVSALSQIIANHLAATGIRTFIIGMEGATDSNLEALGRAGGAEAHNDWCGDVSAPCHYWNVEDGSGDAVASALQAIIGQAVPLPCTYDVAGLTPPPGEVLDPGQVNVSLTQNGEPSTIGQVPDASACPGDKAAWYYDDPTSPNTINLCPHACSVVSQAQSGARVNVVVGCATVTVPT